MFGSEVMSLLCLNGYDLLGSDPPTKRLHPIEPSSDTERKHRISLAPHNPVNLQIPQLTLRTGHLTMLKAYGAKPTV